METSSYLLPAAVTGRMDRREARYMLRSSLRRVTGNKRLRSCGLPFGDMTIRSRDTIHHFSGMSTCGNGWICPVCAAKIRYYRADEVSRAVVAAFEQGMSALFVTRTIPHSAEDRLGVTLHLLGEGRRYVTNQKGVKDVRQAAEYMGSIAAKEITYGMSGFHPHSHDIEFFKHELSFEHFTALSGVYYDYLSRFYAGHGFHGLSRRYGVRVDQIQFGSAALASYIAKVQEGTNIRLRTAQELTRADLKQGRTGSLMPFDIIHAFFETGDMALLDRWHEYERETVYKSVIRFTAGLRAHLLPQEPEQTDEEAATVEVGGEDVVRFAGWFYRKLAKVPGLEGKVLTALDTGGFGTLVELLTVYRLDDQTGYWQETTSCPGPEREV